MDRLYMGIENMIQSCGNKLGKAGIGMQGKLIVIMGTNASGKSGLGVDLAARYGGEVVSADSRQVFRGLDLGSGKITPEETRGVPHHLIDVCEPGDFFSMADFQRLAYAAIDDILSRGKVPFLVGGTGLYVDSVAEGYELSDRAPDLRLRAHLETFSTICSSRSCLIPISTPRTATGLCALWNAWRRTITIPAGARPATMCSSWASPGTGKR